MADYREMWKELGMDVENHDNLCAVLPQAIGDVFLSQKNRPEKMDYFDFVIAEVHGVRPAELKKFREEGGKVFGTFCTYVPDEVIFAGGGIAEPARSSAWPTCTSARQPATERRKLMKFFLRTFRCTSWTFRR